MVAAMLSLPRPFNTIPAAPPLPLSLSSSSHKHHVQSLVLAPIRSSSDGSSNGDGGASAPVPPPITPPDTVEIRFKRGSRKRRKQGLDDDGVDGQLGKMKVAAPKKEWESMTLTEKAVELYMGEKGLLFWLNKFAYASIFIIIGAWIVFRFVGPALNLYQLDAPPLEPTSIFKGS